ncbi:Jag N-terminal domain-containing protein, partial [Acinetobacter sp. 163]|nr:Jag N-terminal domain-containing protein [Acinetobacter sp. 163]
NEAITKACIELGVSSDQLEIQVVSEGSSGFFGFGSKPAVIKVHRLQEAAEDAEIEKIVDSVKLDSFKEEKKAPK